MGEEIRRGFKPEVKPEVSKEELTEKDEKTILARLDSLKGVIRSSVDNSAVRQELLCSIEEAAEELGRKELGPKLRFWFWEDSPEKERLRKRGNRLSEWLQREPREVIPKGIRKSMEDEVAPLKKEIKDYDDENAGLWKKLEKREKERTEE